MIDWLKVEIPLKHDGLFAGKLMAIDSDGNTEWESEKRFRFEGSHDKRITIKSGYETPEQEEKKEATHLIIDGNLAKFLQGHNIDGIEHIMRLVELTYLEITKNRSVIDHYACLSMLYSDFTLHNIRKGLFDVYRIDINHMFDLGSDANVEQWLYACEMRAHARSGRASRDRGTVYLQKGSQLWSLAFYNKYREIKNGGKKHDLSFKLKERKEQFLELIKGKLRVEVRILAKQLKRMELTLAKDLIGEIDNLYEYFLGRCDMKANVELLDDEVSELPQAVIGTYMLWKEGRNVKEMIPKTTYHRHKNILKEFNVDLNVRPADLKQSNVVPLLKVLEAKPYLIPMWFNREYIAQ